MADQKIRVDIIGNSKQLQDSLTKAQRSLKSFGESATKIGRNLSLRITAPLALAGGAAIKFATDTEESLNKVRVAFGDSAGEVEDFAKTSLESFGIARGSALDMTALFGDMATGMGVSRSAAAKLSTDLVGLAGDLASFKNINIAEVTTALSGVFTGETESLKRLGIVMTEVNLKQFALNQGIKTQIKDMTQAEKVALRFQYVLSVTGNAQGDFARTSEGAANQGRIFQESLKELAATFGEILLPTFTKIITKLNGVIKVFKNLDPRTKKVVVVIGLLAAAIPPLILVVGSLATAFAALNVASGAVGAAIIALTAVVGNVVAYQSLKNEIKAIEDTLPDLKKGLDAAKKSLDGTAESSLKAQKAQKKLLEAELKLLKLQQDKEQGAIAKILGIESDAYKELTQKIKDTEAGLKNLNQNIELTEKNTTSLSGSTNKLVEGYVKLSEVGFGDEFEKQMEKLLKANQRAADQAELQDIKVGMGIDGTQEGLFDLDSLEGAVAALDELEDIQAMEDLGVMIDDLQPKFDQLKDKMEQTKEVSQLVGNSIINAFGQIGQTLVESLGLGEGALGSFTAAFIGAALDAVAAALSVSVANAIAAASAGSLLSGPLAPVVLPALIAGLTGLVKGAFSSNVPALANGGIVSAPTLAMVGDNRGAGRGNPEVIAPLNKLEGMLRGSQSVNVGGEFRVQGQDLVVALQRANRNRDRIL